MFIRKILIYCFPWLFVVFLTGGIAHAVPAAPVVHTLSQPDGSTFEARQWGDEWLHGWETLDGYSIVFDEDLESWTYAMHGADGRLVSSLMIVGKENPRSDVSKYIRPIGQARMMIPPQGLSGEVSTVPLQGVIPPTGTANIPVILINFSNTTTTYTSGNFNTLLFGTGNYSMKDYYQEVSYGAFTVSAGPSGVVGWYQASNTHDYYGADVGGQGNDAWPGDLVYEAVVAADAAGFNFAAYDKDGDCYVDVVAIIHQGSGQEASGVATDIWSHRWDLNSAKYYGRSHYGEFTTNSTCSANPSKKVKVNGYIIQPETLWGGQQTMGVFAHEYGHALGLPDLYDTDGSSEGIGNWSLMAGGSWNYVSMSGDRPAHLDAWCKYKLGWVTPTEVTGTLTNEPVTQAATMADVYKLRAGTPTSGEYFLVENRQKVGFDTGLPGPGLLVWHIDGNTIATKTSANQVNNSECYPGGPSCAANHFGVALVQADNLWSLEKKGNRGDSGDPYPGSTNKTSFMNSSSPNSNLYNGNPSNVSLTNISASGSTMTATMSAVSGPPDAATLISPSGTITDTTPTYTWNAVSNSTWYCLYVNDATGTNINQWYTADACGCASGTGTCSVTSTTEVVGSSQWYIRTYNSVGLGPWSAPLSFTVVPPPAATLVSPTGAIQNNTPAYIWNAVLNSTWYCLYVNDSTGNKINQWYTAEAAGCGSGTGTCSVTPATEVVGPVGFPCKWYVRTYSSAGLGSWSIPGMSFTTPIPTPPLAATLVSPSGNIDTNTPAYTWNAVFNSTWYCLYVNDSTGNKINQWYTAAGVGCGSGTGTCTVTPTTEVTGPVGSPCKWYIRTYNSAGYGPWSSEMLFSTPIPTPPPAATLISPSGIITDTTPTYTWNAARTSTWYCLYVKDSTGNKINQWYTAAAVGCGSGTGTCSVTPTTEVVGSCQWYIRTYNSGGLGQWSIPGMSFTVSPPPASTLISPSGTITDTTPSYIWNAVVDATWYRLWVKDTTGDKILQWYSAANAGCPAGTGTCSVTPAPFLIGTGQWRIQTYSSAGYGPWSSPLSFSAPSLTGTWSGTMNSNVYGAELFGCTIVQNGSNLSGTLLDPVIGSIPFSGTISGNSAHLGFSFWYYGYYVTGTLDLALTSFDGNTMSGSYVLTECVAGYGCETDTGTFSLTKQ